MIFIPRQMLSVGLKMASQLKSDQNPSKTSKKTSLTRLEDQQISLVGVFFGKNKYFVVYDYLFT